MTVEEQVIEKLRALPPQKQEEVLQFVNGLEQSTPLPRQDLMGLFADLNIKISEKDISEARREMWENFPRDIS